MKKFLVVLAMLLPLVSFAQQEDAKKQMTKFEEFTSKTGSIIKFTGISMSKMPLIYGSLETGIRILKGSPTAYFYRLEQEENIAMIEYSDLVEINKALVKLSSEVESDIAANPDYLENKFRTVDGFEVGYFISKGKANWYLKLERYSNSTVFVKSQDIVIEGFKNAQAKIEELKAAGN